MTYNNNETSNTVVRREQCPSCAANGNDNKGDNLVRYDDGHAHCFACGYHENARGEAKPSTSGKKLRRGEFHEDFIKVAGILSHALKAYGVFPLVDGGGTARQLCFPYRDHSGNICRAKVRSISPDWESLDRDFKFIKVAEDPQGTRKMVPLFGWKPVDRLPKNIIIFEGESDLLTYVSYAKIPDDWYCMALAGATNAKNAAIALNEYKGNIHLVFDNDDAGKKAEREFLAVRPAAVNTLPLDKDVRDYIVRNKYEAPVFTWERNDGLVRDLLHELEVYQNNIQGEPTIVLPAPFNKMMHPRSGAFFVVAGNTGSGKSFFIDWLINLAVSQGKKILLHSLELTPGEVVSRLLFQRLGRRFVDVNDPHIIKLVRKLQDKLFVNNSVSNMASIRNQIVSVGGVDVVVVDTLSLFTGSTEWDALTKTSYDLKKLSTDQSLGAPMVVATSQMSLKNVSPEKVSTDNLFGAAGIAQAADMILYVASNEDGSNRFKVIKRDRVLGNYGSVDCYFDFDRVMFVPVEEEGGEFDAEEYFRDNEPPTNYNNRQQPPKDDNNGGGNIKPAPKAPSGSGGSSVNIKQNNGGNNMTQQQHKTAEPVKEENNNKPLASELPVQQHRTEEEEAALKASLKGMPYFTSVEQAHEYISKKAGCPPPPEHILKNTGEPKPATEELKEEPKKDNTPPPPVNKQQQPIKRFRGIAKDGSFDAIDFFFGDGEEIEDHPPLWPTGEEEEDEEE